MSWPQDASTYPDGSKRDWNKDWPTAQSERPKHCMACGKATKKPEVWKPDHSKWSTWEYKTLKRLRADWIVRCTKCEAIHVWSFGNVYKVHTDPLDNVALGEN